MFKKFMGASLLLAALTCEAQAATSAKAQTVAWRGGYRYRRSSAPASTGAANYGSRNYGYRGSSGQTSSGRRSALDYPPSSQPYASRIHQWNKYPNQPFYLRGERRSLGILP